MCVFVSLTCALFVVPKMFLVRLIFSPPLFSCYPWAHLMKGRKGYRDGFDDLTVFPWRDSVAQMLFSVSHELGSPTYKIQLGFFDTKRTTLLQFASWILFVKVTFNVLRNGLLFFLTTLQKSFRISQYIATTKKGSGETTRWYEKP